MATKPTSRVPSFLNDGTDPLRPKWAPPVIEDQPDADGQYLLESRYGKYVQFLEQMANALVGQGAIPECLDVMNLLMKYGHDVTAIKKKVDKEKAHPVKRNPLTREPVVDDDDGGSPDLSKETDEELQRLMTEGQ